MKNYLLVINIVLIALLLVGCGNNTNEEVTTTQDITTEIVSSEESTTEEVTKEIAEDNTQESEDDSDKTIDVYEDEIEMQNCKHHDADIMIYDNWCYGHDWNSNGESIFVKERLEGGDYTKLDDCYAINIYVRNAYVYYLALYEDKEKGGIFKVRTSGEDKEAIIKGDISSMQIKGDYIYYTEGRNLKAEDITEKSSHLYRCDLDGKNKTEIIKKPTFYFYVHDDMIIYQDDRDNCSIHICNIDGSDDKKINNDKSFSPIYDGKYIYYSKEIKLDKKDENGEDQYSYTLWRMNVDGTNDTQLSECKLGRDPALYNGFIYFSNEDDGNRLYRINADGSNLSLISQDKNATDYYFIGDVLKYTVYTEDWNYVNKIILCNPDGSDIQDWEFNR